MVRKRLASLALAVGIGLTGGCNWGPRSSCCPQPCCPAPPCCQGTPCCSSGGCCPDASASFSVDPGTLAEGPVLVPPGPPVGAPVVPVVPAVPALPGPPPIPENGGLPLAPAPAPRLVPQPAAPATAYQPYQR